MFKRKILLNMNKPSIKPQNPNFSSGPCSKRPGWTIDVLKNTPIGRSHRHKVCKEKLNEAIVKSKKIFKHGQTIYQATKSKFF